MNDCILIKDLSLHAFHGVHAEEARLGQRFVLDITVFTDLRPACQSDDYRQTLCYDTMIEQVTRAFTQQRFNLIEAAADAVARALLDQHPAIARLIIELRKPFAPIAAQFSSVGVRIERYR
jgi:7,8-dihydroneopterin aldolase/epimerase/oxygenase